MIGYNHLISNKREWTNCFIKNNHEILLELADFALQKQPEENLIISILGLQPIPGDLKDNGVAAMLDDRTFCFVIQHGRHAVVFLYLQGLVANQEFLGHGIMAQIPRPLSQSN